MYAPTFEGESKELALIGFNYVAFGGVNHQLQMVFQISADAAEHALTCTLTFYHDGKIIRVTSKRMPTFLEFFIQRIEHDVRQ